MIANIRPARRARRMRGFLLILLALSIALPVAGMQVAGLVFVDAGHSGVLERFGSRQTSIMTIGACLGILRLIDPFSLRNEGSDASARLPLYIESSLWRHSAAWFVGCRRAPGSCATHRLFATTYRSLSLRLNLVRACFRRATTMTRARSGASGPFCTSSWPTAPRAAPGASCPAATT
jgi:hypothetical protein